MRRPTSPLLAALVVALAAALAAALAIGTPASAELLIQHRPPADDAARAARAALTASGVLETVVELVNEQYTLNGKVVIQLGADDGPLYDPEADEIWLPDGFYDEVLQRFRADGNPDPEAATLDAITHTLFHELAHVLIAHHDLPVLGREEDAADALASVILIEQLDNGGDSLLSAAELFALEGEARGDPEEPDFWDEHSLDEQRYYATLCHLYGSDPAGNAYIAEDLQFDPEHRERCEFEYGKLVDDWAAVLAPLAPQD